MQKIEKLVFMAHPLEVDDTRSYLEMIKRGEIKKKVESRWRTRVSVLNYFLDFFLNLKWAYSNKKEVFDLWVGVDPLNAVCGILLRKLGKINRVVYYCIDYYPLRFENRFLNYLYYQLDKFCVRHADETWNVSDKMVEARKKKCGMSPSAYSRQKTVPIGVWFDRVKRKDLSQINKHQAVFVGYLKDEMGVDLVIRSIPEIIKKIPDFEFLLIGGGDEYENLKKLCQELEVESYVVMTNWVKDRLRLEDLMLGGAVGLAPFNVNICDEKFYNADPTKIKDYLQMGMPVILTSVPASSEQLRKAGCAIIIDYDEKSLADAITDLLQDEEILRIYRQRAVEYIKDYDWNKIFGDNLSRILN
jgi:glycosyltransferase involved in cell wall biosynthesis